jgi:S-adenosylmethionine:tRNA ribosyltransferase-isomerase
MIPAYYNRIIAVGTTSVRTLETLYWLGVKALSRREPDNDEMLSLEQWEEYTLDDKVTVIESFEALLGIMDKKKLDYLRAKTSIMIVPGYDFRIVNGLITNFHQPRSTLLLLVAAFIGPGWRDVYNYALNKNFRFLSYGDSSLFFR